MLDFFKGVFYSPFLKKKVIDNFHLKKLYKQFLEYCKTDENVYIDKQGDYMYLTENINPEFKSIKKMRDESENKDAFDLKIKDSVRVIPQDRSDKQRTWIPFQSKIDNTLKFIFAKQIYPKYLRYVFGRFYQEGVKHFEGKSLFFMTDVRFFLY